MPTPQDGPDVQFHGASATGTLSELAVDLGGWESDFTVDTGALVSASDARFDLYQSAALEFRVNCNNGDTGYLWAYSTSHRIRIDSGVITLLVNASGVIDYTVVNMSGSTDDFLITWSWQPNPLTTGASDAYRSELVVRNETNGTWEFATAVHAEPADGTETAVIGGTAAGADLFSGLIYTVRLCRRFHCTTEIYETWVAESSAPTLSGDSRLESPVATLSSGLGNDGMFSGPVELMAAAAVRSNDRITYAPVVNEICTGAWAEDSTWTETDPDNAGVEMHAEFMRRRPIPPGFNRARVRVHVQQNAASAQDLTIRAYCGNLPGSFISPNPVGYEVFSAASTRNADDGTGTTGGAWVTVAESLRLPTHNTDYLCFWLGFIPGSVTDYRARAWTVELFEDQDPDGFGSGGGFGG